VHSLGQKYDWQWTRIEVLELCEIIAAGAHGMGEVQGCFGQIVAYSEGAKDGPWITPQKCLSPPITPVRRRRPKIAFTPRRKTARIHPFENPNHVGTKYFPIHRFADSKLLNPRQPSVSPALATLVCYV